MVRLLILGLLLFPTLTAWASKPLADWWTTPDQLGMTYQSLSLTTPDRVHLAAWLVEPAAQAPSRHTTMVLAGSDYGNMSYQLTQAKALSEAGYRVLLFDYRGFGHSGAFAIDSRRLYYPEFATDVRTALRAAQRRAPHQRVGLVGYSMGSLLASMVAATTRCNFLITDSYLARPRELVAYLAAQQKTVTLPAEAATYEDVAPRINCPWLLIAGTEDPQCPLADSRAVAEAARGRQRREVLAVRCGHLGALETLTSAGYTQAISRFLAGESVSGRP